MKIKIPEYLELDSKNYLYSVVTTEDGETLKLDEKATIYTKEISCNYLILKEEDAGNKATIICDSNAIVVDRDIVPSTYLPSLGREDKPFNTSYFNGLKIPIYGMNDDLDAGIFFSLETSHGGGNAFGFSTASLKADKIGKIYFNSTYGDFDHIGDGDQSISFVVMDSSQNDHYPLVLTTDEVTICDHIIIKESNSRLNLIYKPTTTEYTILSGNGSSASLSTNTEITLSTNPALVDMTQDSQGGGQILFAFQAFNETSRNSSFYLTRHSFYPINDSNQNSSLGTNNNRWKKGWFTDISTTYLGSTGNRVSGIYADEVSVNTSLRLGELTNLYNGAGLASLDSIGRLFSCTGRTDDSDPINVELPMGVCVEAVIVCFGKFQCNETNPSTSTSLTLPETYRTSYEGNFYSGTYIGVYSTLLNRFPNQNQIVDQTNSYSGIIPIGSSNYQDVSESLTLGESHFLIYLPSTTEGKIRLKGKYTIFLLNPINFSSSTLRQIKIGADSVKQKAPYKGEYVVDLLYYVNNTILLAQKYRCLISRCS